MNAMIPPSAGSIPAQLSPVLEAWATALGPEHVVTGAELEIGYCRSTLPEVWRTRPAAALRPGSREEVIEAVRIAHQFNVPLHPISRGQNWGYGGPLPPCDQMVILDLSRLNRILEVNTELGYAVIEPGVSQKQLYDYLTENHIPLIPDATGAGPDASIVGNVLQRGFGHTPYGNRVLHVANMEVVLPDGQVIHTGFGDFPSARAAHVFPYGLGPWLDGSFTQSSRGVVTRMTIWLLPKPEQLIGFALKVPRSDDLERVIDALRPLCLDGVVRSTVHVANDLRVISARGRYPYELAAGRTPLPDALRAALRQQYGIGAWNLMGGLYGSRRMVRAAKADIRRAFRKVAHVHFFGPRLLRLGQSILRGSTRLGLGRSLLETVESAESVYRLLCGNPAPEHLRGVFWRHKTLLEPLDVARAGVLWFSPVVPMRGRDALELVGLVDPVFTQHGFEPLVTLSAVTTRALVSVISVCYDPESPDQIVAARACYEQLSHSLCTAGFYPYRTGLQSHQERGT
jgi:4-cresol dehydrogenase (hydroxylating)